MLSSGHVHLIFFTNNPCHPPSNSASALRLHSSSSGKKALCVVQNVQYARTRATTSCSRPYLRSHHQVIALY